MYITVLTALKADSRVSGVYTLVKMVWVPRQDTNPKYYFYRYVRIFCCM